MPLEHWQSYYVGSADLEPADSDRDPLPGPEARWGRRSAGPDWQCLVIRRSGLGRANIGFDSVPWQQRVLIAMQCPGYGGGESNRGRRGGRRGRSGGRSGRPGRASESLSQVPQLGSGPGPRPVDFELESAVCRTSRCQCQCVTR
jgi:hypothetical protein